MKKMLKNLIAVLLVITLSGANFVLLSMYGISYALSENEISGQTTATQNANVEFNAYLEGGGHSSTAKSESKDVKLYLNVKVKNSGYLKNSEVTFQDMNFKINGAIESEKVQSVDLENNKLILKQIDNGSDVTIVIPIAILDTDKVPVDNFSKETKTIFAGTYIDAIGKEKKVSKEIVNKISWSDKAEASLATEITKYIPYENGEKYGVLVQTKINSGVKDGKLPIKETSLEVTAPEISKIKPTSVVVIANHTKATNGLEDGTNFVKENYSYDAETGITKINVKNNVNEKGQISWIKNIQDEYLVTYIFEGQQLYNEAKTNGIDSKITTNAKIATYGNDGAVLEKMVELEVKASKTIGTMSDFSIETSKEIAKGYIYANYQAVAKKETNYLVSYSATINQIDLTNEIEFVQSIDKFVTEDGKIGLSTVENKNYTYNKVIRIRESIFKKILGEEGSISLLNAEGIVIGTISKDIKKDEEGNYSLDISSLDNNQLTIKTSKPICAGTIVIDVEKAVKGEVGYSQTQMKSFVKINTELTGKATTAESKLSQEILLQEVKSVAEIEVSKKDLTTVVENENIEIRATLDTSSIYNALYVNPTLKIKLPSYIENIEIKSANILMDGGLTIKDVKIIKENDSQVIQIKLNGTQKEYAINAEYKGAIIVLNTDLTVATLTPSHESKIVLTYTNENEVTTNKYGTDEVKINFIAPTGVVAANGIINYAANAEEVMSIADESANVSIDTFSGKRIATVTGKVVNNYANKINNVIILGRFPSKDNTKIDSTETLGSTFDATLNSAIEVSGIESGKYTVYYSNKADATKDLENTDNGWKAEATTAAKSYMILTNGYEMNEGETIEFKYNIEIPENLEYNNDTYLMYKVYYNNVSPIGIIAETKTSPILRTTTGEGPKIEANVTSTVDTVREGQIVKMKVTVKNTGSITANNVKVNIPVPQHSEFIEYVTGNGFYDESMTTKTIDVGNLEPGKSEEVCYYIKMNNNINSSGDGVKLPTEILHKATISSDELPVGISSNEYKMNVQDGKMTIQMISDTSESHVLKNNQALEYTINVYNNEGKTMNNVIVSVRLPEQIKYESAMVKDNWSDATGTVEGVSYDQESNTIQIKIDTLQIKKVIMLQVKVKEFEGYVSMMTTAQADGVEQHYSNITEYKTEKVELQVSELSSTPKYVKEGETVTYKLSVTNKGKAIVYDVKIKDVLPEGLGFVKAMYTYNGSTNTVLNSNGNNVTITINQLAGGETTEITIIAKAALLPNKNDKQVENKVTITAKDFNAVETNNVTNVVEYNQELHEQHPDIQPDDGNDNDNNNNEPTIPTSPRYKITGTAWVDVDKDGRRDADEKILANVPVILIYKSNNTIVRDLDTNEEKRTNTNNRGTYEFSNLAEGEYLVIFLYEAAKYTLTTYQAKDVEDVLNSDAIDINITLDGSRRVAGITDIIKITNANVRDVDIGLYSAEKFDFRIDKYISKITLTTPTIGTKTYTYKDSQAAKIEVLEANIGKSDIVVEYKIVVTNEGAVSGYAKKIVDYLPKHTKFSTELNKDWYLSENGNVYNLSLANEKINPGETKELTLTLTARITEESLGVLNNNAEIYEIHNEQGLKDIDSTAGNNQSREDDISRADLVLAIVTGESIITYITLALGIAVLLVFGIYEIKKRVLKKKIV